MTRWADLTLQLPSASERWSSGAFRDELRGWVASVVGEPSALEPVKTRAWATVWRAETASGVFFAKQNCATQAYEAAVVVALNDLAHRHVVPLTGADIGRGLFLTPDLGRTLGDAGVDDVDTWCRVAAAGAQLQVEVSRYADRLVEAGLTVLAPGDAVEYVERRLDEFAALPDGDPRAPAPAALAGVRARLPEIAGWADQVGALGLPLTLCHNDLHGHNVFDVGGELRFFDFADAMVTEPLAALLIPLHLLDGDERDRRRVADAALETWTDYAPAAELRAALPAALQLARLARVESWIRCTAPMNDAELDQWGSSAGAWLGSLSDAPPVDHG
ncbi:phosphotransferase [Nocardioides caricicola]|uniref:Phosphotransferase n=1 Tax=Nocardioides caricicola TaxID=634770 RepID=A0ABW0N8P5_9ACTN